MTNQNPNPDATRSTGAGIAYMCLGVLFLVALDVSARWLLERYSLTQLVFLRCIFSIILLLLYAAGSGRLGALRTRRPGWHVFRSALMAGSMLSFFHALRFIPLADIMIFAFAAPLMVTALSQPVLGESVGSRRWAAVIVGFAGVLVVLRPGSGTVHPAAIYAVIGAAFYAGLGLTARKLSTTESTMSLSLYVFAAPLAIAGALCVPVWQAPGGFDWFMFFVCGAFGGLGTVFINAAYQRAPAAMIVPFEYTALIWAAGAGFVFWGEVPDGYAWLGAAIITASGLFILYRETRARTEIVAPTFPLQEAVGAAAREPGDDGRPQR